MNDTGVVHSPEVLAIKSAGVQGLLRATNHQAAVTVSGGRDVVSSSLYPA